MLQLVTTADGSSTFYDTEVGEHYHSKHGALQESRHVFLQAGLAYYLGKHPQTDNVTVLEVGFGTGLNFLLSAAYCSNLPVRLTYTGIEPNPLPLQLLAQTGYRQVTDPAIWDAFLAHYVKACTQSVSINTCCNLHIPHCTLVDYTAKHQADVLYFDAFAALHQPMLWTNDSISHACSFLKPGGVFVTYAITGNLKRCLKSLHFSIEKLPGAPGKREMLRAVKQD